MTSARRDVDPIRAAIRDEFESHLAACAAELERSGWSSEAARDEASRRFGRFHVYEEACRREAPEDFMRSKTTFAMTVGVAVFAGSIALLAFAVVRQGRVLARIESALAAAPTEQAASREALVAQDRQQEASGVVFIYGEVPRPGVYELPSAGGTLTTSRLLVAVGAEPIDLRVFLRPKADAPTRIADWKRSGGEVATRDGEPCMVVLRSVRDGIGGGDPALRPGDMIWVARQ